MSFEEQIMSKDNYSCMFPKLKVVYCLHYPSSISSHSESSGETKHEAKHVDFLVLSGTAFSTSFPYFLISKLKKNAPFRSLFARRGLLAVSGHYRLITSARYWVTCHDSTNHAREEIFDGL